MLILIAESKTMLASEKDVSPEALEAHSPVFEDIAAEIMASLEAESVIDIAATLKLSGSLAAKIKKMVYEFAFKNTGNQAIEAFTGVVFKSLDFPTLPEEAKQRCLSQVRIISSLYGWLRPADFVKPYRLDFTSRLEEGPSAGKALNMFWRTNVTKALVKTLQENHFTEIINLLPADAAKCIDWKLVKHFAKVWKVDFQQIREGGVMKTPSAERLKSMRGALLRQILQEDVVACSDIMHLSSDKYVCDGTPQYPDHLHFLC